MGIKQKPDITKEESGLQQYDRVGSTREPSLSYDENGKRLRPNNIPDRSEAEDRAINEAIIANRDNRRNQDHSQPLPKDKIDPSFGR